MAFREVFPPPNPYLESHIDYIVIPIPTSHSDRVKEGGNPGGIGLNAPLVLERLGHFVKLSPLF